MLSIFICSCENKIKAKGTDIPILTNTNKSKLNLSMDRGGKIYTNFCVQCHMVNGKGIPNNFPPLANSNWLTEKRTKSIQSVKYGQNEEIIVNGIMYDGVMVPMSLSDSEIADVMNYVMNSWGNTQKSMVTPKEVAAIDK
jgi:mono/diheme cytochrome c family protein